MKQSLLILLVVIVLSSCGNKQKKVNSEKKDVGTKTLAVTNYPLYYFTKKIAGHEYEVLFLVSQEADPAYFELDAETVAKYQSADIIFINGAGYEGWIDKVALSQRKIVNTTKAIQDKYITEKGHSHSHGPDGEHEHVETAFTTWLDQSIALAQASHIFETLKSTYPSGSSEFEKNYKELKADLLELDKKMDNVFNPYKGKTIYASHPVYQYLAQRYGITIKSKHWEPGQKVDTSVMNSFINSIADNDTKVMLWEGEPHPETRKQLEDAGVNLVLFIPCGNVPETGDYIAIMKKNIDNQVLLSKN